MPLAGMIKMLPDFIADGLFSHSITLHLLRDKSVFMTLAITPDTSSELLDKLTSSVIKRGGTLRATNRTTLDSISPYLAKRILGDGAVELHHAFKELFDPNDIMVRNQSFFI
jgi:hypothetical protein